MATNSVGAGKVVISGSVAKDIGDEIARRAKSLDMSKSRYAAKVLEQWYASGCPPISKQDEVMRQIEKMPRQARVS